MLEQYLKLGHDRFPHVLSNTPITLILKFDIYLYSLHAFLCVLLIQIHKSKVWLVQRQVIFMSCYETRRSSHQLIKVALYCNSFYHSSGNWIFRFIHLYRSTSYTRGSFIKPQINTPLTPRLIMANTPLTPQLIMATVGSFSTVFPFYYFIPFSFIRTSFSLSFYPSLTTTQKVSVS